MTDAAPGSTAVDGGEAATEWSSGGKRQARSRGKAAAPPGDRRSPERAAVLDQVLGQVARLMAATPNHKHHFLSDLEWLVMPPLALGQARLIRDAKGNPLAFACWALVSEEVEKRFQAGHPRLGPQEWRSGERLWLIDVVAPDPALPTVLTTLQEEVFRGAKVRTLLKAPQGQAERRQG